MHRMEENLRFENLASTGLAGLKGEKYYANQQMGFGFGGKNSVESFGYFNCDSGITGFINKEQLE